MPAVIVPLLVVVPEIVRVPIPDITIEPVAFMVIFPP